MYNQIKPFLSQKKHSFVRKQSTITNLLEYKNYLCETLAKGGQIDAIYTDFKTEFDKVELSEKLVNFGIHSNLLRWVEFYQSNKSQLVALKGFNSVPVIVKYGVPQGSHLEPLFFIAYINEFTNKLSSPCLIYVDDLKLYRAINGASDCWELQRDLNVVNDWCQCNKMHL